jgi:hypothetical protein
LKRRRARTLPATARFEPGRGGFEGEGEGRGERGEGEEPTGRFAARFFTRRRGAGPAHLERGGVSPRGVERGDAGHGAIIVDGNGDRAMVDQGKPEEGEEETRHARLGCADDASKVAHEEIASFRKTLRTTPSDHSCQCLLSLD